MEQDNVTLHLPAGYTIESAPQTPDITWSNHALLRIQSTVKEGSVEVVRIFARGFCLLDPKDYGNLHDFYQKIAAADQQQLVLAKTPPAPKGNQ
jgi:hypothetical protein